MTTAVTDPVEPSVEHTHVHNWVGGERKVAHAHPMPVSADGPNANRPHRHSNGRHSHPHGHGMYGES